MSLVHVYQCLCDEQRLRILNLLRAGPLCVCHLQEILEAPQVKVSKQLAYMKRLGVVSDSRQGTWRIYALAEPPPPLLLENLRCLQDLASEWPELRRDLEQREQILTRLCGEQPTLGRQLLDQTNCC